MPHEHHPQTAALQGRLAGSAAGALLILGMVLLASAGALAAQQDFPALEAPLLTQTFRQRWLWAGLADGRVRITATRFGTFTNARTSPSGSEQLQVQVTGTATALKYESNQQDYQLLVEMDDQGLRIRLRPLGNAQVAAVEFSQPGRGPLTLSVEWNGATDACQADSIWFLMIARPDLCRRYLVPLLRVLNEQWELEETGGRIETALTGLAAEEPTPNVQQWAALVAQLGDPSFGLRQQADRQLREQGPLAIAYLEHLDWKRLDAEQRYRLRRIVDWLKSSVDHEQPEQVARWMAGDPATWLALLSRDDESTRRQAAQWLASLLGGPVRFDPAAEPEVRRQQVEQLRARLANW